MIKQLLANIFSLVILASLTVTSALAATSLDGAKGNVFKVDLEKRSFELLKETEYDPKSDVGQSRFTVHWTGSTLITRVEPRTSFTGIKGPVITEFSGLDAANLAALKNGKPFVARVATVLTGVADPAAADAEKQAVGWFTPEAGENPTGGSVLIDDKPVKVSLRKSNSSILVRQPIRPADLASGFWKASIKGHDGDSGFVIDSMDVTPLGDPRKTDDPKLPRVLVIGDSISMNYDDAARTALRGVANYHRNEGNSMSTAAGVRNAELWLGNYQEKGLHWDVIQFNHGLHDLKQTYDAASDAFGAYAVTPEDYKRNLEKEISILKQTGAVLIWCSTTPVPNDSKGTYARRKGAAEVFNQAAMEVMRKHPEILINDLYQVVNGSPAFDNWRKTADVHFYKPDEQKVLGEAVAATVRMAIAKARDSAASPKNH